MQILNKQTLFEVITDWTVSRSVLRGFENDTDRDFSHKTAIAASIFLVLFAKRALLPLLITSFAEPFLLAYKVIRFYNILEDIYSPEALQLHPTEPLWLWRWGNLECPEGDKTHDHLAVR